MQNDIPLCVDLDGTLVRKDLLLTALQQQIRKSFFKSFHLLFILLSKGRAAMKSIVMQQVDELQLQLHLQFHPDLVGFLTQQSKHRKLILVTANDQRIARYVAKQLGFFSDVMASDGVVNLKGSRKSKTLVAKFGVNGFDYIGNSYSDIPVWQKARKVYIVSNNSRLIAKVKKLRPIERIFTWKN